MTAFIVAGEDTGEMYEWDVTDVWYDPETEKFYIYSSGGCSCNWAYDEYTDEDGSGHLTDFDGPYTFHEVLNEISVNLVEKMLKWERAGKPETGDTDRW